MFRETKNCPKLSEKNFGGHPNVYKHSEIRFEGVKLVFSLSKCVLKHLNSFLTYPQFIAKAFKTVFCIRKIIFMVFESFFTVSKYVAKVHQTF